MSVSLLALGAAGGGKTLKWEKLTVSGTWTVPSDVHVIYVKMAGGGKGGEHDTLSAAYGGVGSDVFLGYIQVTPGASMPYTIGAGGAGALVGSDSFGADGGLTTFGGVTIGTMSRYDFTTAGSDAIIIGGATGGHDCSAGGRAGSDLAGGGGSIGNGGDGRNGGSTPGGNGVEGGGGGGARDTTGAGHAGDGGDGVIYIMYQTEN